MSGSENAKGIRVFEGSVYVIGTTQDPGLDNDYLTIKYVPTPMVPAFSLWGRAGLAMLLLAAGVLVARARLWSRPRAAR